ncbi:MAG TPA: signal peptidase I [Chloroflexota bacterium]|nr:signal peptidase I [Chloroflexota bacterium]
MAGHEYGDRRIARAIWYVAQICLQVGVLVLLFSVLVGRFEVRSVSMEPNLVDGQRVVVSKLDHLWPGALIGQAEASDGASTSPFAPHRGQVVVFTEGTDPHSSLVLIKRVVGLPGETIVVRNGKVLVDGQPIDEAYLHGVSTNCSFYCGPLTLGPHRYFVMGDNRPDSWDSRSFGPISDSQIIGEVILRYWPLDKVQLYF